ncbi:MAG: hypothetical protein QG552_1500 [Thermodesulfobacteriota bacterium]|nr:hypothetical protein [Thermodesulfobacteriota bacterium]
MKKILTAIAAALFLLLPAAGFAGYVIHLKDGTKFVTDQYFEEGDQIRFKRYGGLVGIEKDRVREIVETDAVLQNGISTLEQPAVVPPEKAKLENEKDKEKGVDIKEELDPDLVYKERKIELVKKLREALQSYKRAKEIGEKNIIDEEFRRTSQMSSELSKLEKEVKARHDGILPGWWDETENVE